MLGGVHGLMFALPLAALAGFAQIATFTLAWLLIRGAGPARAGWRTFLFSLGSFTVGLAWLYISMNTYGGMPGVLAALAVVALSAYLSLYSAAALALSRRLLPRAGRPGPAGTACVVAACWSLAELARGYVLTGFPWLSVGYAHVDAPWAGLASWTGVYGLSAFAVLVAVWLAELLSVRAGTAHRPRQAMALGLVVVAALAAATVRWAAPAGAPLTVRLAQGNVPQSLKFDPVRAERATLEYLRMIAQSKADLTVLPETAIVRPIERLAPATREALATALRTSGGVAAIGIPAFSATGQARQDGRPLLTNSILSLDADGKLLNRYDKRHLVPFGEFIPPGFAWFVDLMNIPLGNFGRGGDAQPMLVLKGRNIGFNICYEDLFGEEIALQIRQGANVMINLSNIAWFGNSHALPQHLAISRMRSLEFQRPMLRATNTGVTASIDAGGRVLDALPYFEHTVLDTTVQPTTGLTPYARAGTAAPLALAAMLLAGGLLAARRRPT